MAGWHEDANTSNLSPVLHVARVRFPLLHRKYVVHVASLKLGYEKLTTSLGHRKGCPLEHWVVAGREIHCKKPTRAVPAKPTIRLLIGCMILKGFSHNDRHYDKNICRREWLCALCIK